MFIVIIECIILQFAYKLNFHSNVKNIVVLRVGQDRYGVIVDQIFEFEEVVSRKISEQIHSSSMFHGASWLGTGEVAMILSAEGIARKEEINVSTQKQSQIYDESLTELTSDEVFEEFMLFKYNEEQFLCLHLEEVERLEKIKANTIERIGENHIVRYLNKVLPIIEPASTIGLQQFDMEKLIQESQDDLLEVIVVNIEGEQVGLLVHKLDEIQNSFEKINTETISDPGLKGSVFINNTTICVLDLEFVCKSLRVKKNFKVREFNSKIAA